ncbi:MAG: SH3 domain-containing protein, partial [Acidobacteriota bacterium]
MRDWNRTFRKATRIGFCAGLALALFTFKADLLLAASPDTSTKRPTAVIVVAVQDLFVRPDETSSVDDQVILGDRVEILEDAAGFAKVRTPAGEVAWIPERALRRGEEPQAPAPGAKIARVTSNFAHVYATPSFTKQKPLLTAPVGAGMEIEDFLEGKEGRPHAAAPPGEVYSWVKVRLPDGRTGFVAARDVSLFTFKENLPLYWIALGKRFLGAPYTWGGT